MRAALYLRVSTQEQHTQNQLPALMVMAQRHEDKVVAIYQEAESAWRAGHQANLARLLEDAHKGRFQTLYVWSMDRLTRAGPLAILGLVDRLRRSGVRVVSYQEPWTEAPGELGDLLYSIVGWVARMESQRRSERTKAGLARARAEGKRLGRPPRGAVLEAIKRSPPGRS
ncbi:MAG: recombinase family protein [Chloroflexi bacterium]|nr:recombinase family protein [Chloroflexota bacterium]